MVFQLAAPHRKLLNIIPRTILKNEHVAASFLDSLL
jgi:hypothetical protein